MTEVTEGVTTDRTAIITAEEQVIGACLYPNDAYREVAKIVQAEDFSNFRMGQVFKIIAQLDFEGTIPDPGTVAELFDQYEVKNYTSADLWRIQGFVPTGSVGPFYAERVHDDAQRRRVHQILIKANQDLQHDAVSVGDTIAETVTGLNVVADDSPGHERIDPRLLLEILQNEDDDYDWVSPGLLERGDRMIVTGPEGFGKTTWLRQLAIMFAAGLHPITGRKVAPLKVLYIDPENSEVQWRREVRPVVRVAAQQGSVNPLHSLRLAITPRLNLVTGYDLARIHRLIDELHPDIIFIGPLYKLTKGSLNNEDDAAALINSLDSLHDRGVCLIMEAHAAKGNMGGRNWTPRGSGALAAWPEFGLALVPDPDLPDVGHLERWRGDRDAKRLWPKTMVRGSMFPWMPND